MNVLLQGCWAQDIVTVVPAGNIGDDNNGVVNFLDERTPQSLGTPGNGVITVGGVTYDGVLWPQTRPDRGQGGSITVYAQAADVVFALAFSDTAPNTGDGTSLAALAVVSGPYTRLSFANNIKAGLAAYFFGLSSLDRNWNQGTVSTDIKNFIAQYAYVRNMDPIPAGTPNAPQANSIKVAYNRAPDGYVNFVSCGL
jgi:hypothetical protein